jgi:hypothetical protein
MNAEFYSTNLDEKNQTELPFIYLNPLRIVENSITKAYLKDLNHVI